MTTEARLVAAAALCIVALGLAWAHSFASLGYYTGGNLVLTNYPSFDGGPMDMGLAYAPGWWIAADPMAAARGYESDARVVLVPAAVIFGWAVAHRSEQVARLVRAASVALVVIGVMALARGMFAAAIAVLAAAALARPVATPQVASWRFRARAGR